MGSVNSLDIAEVNATTYQEHNNLASYYDNLAKEMDGKATQKRELLHDYEEHSYYYGRRGQDFKSHTEANLRYYEKAAQDSLKKADYHRKIAVEILNRDYAKPNESLDPAISRKIKVKLNSDSNNLN